MANRQSRFDITSTIMEADLYGKNVYLLGTSEFGPTNTPTYVSNDKQVAKIFGKKGSLYQSFKEVIEGSDDANVIIVKSTGTHSIVHMSVNTRRGSIIRDGFIIKAKDSNERYNNLKVGLTSSSIIFEIPDELGRATVEYKFSDYPSLGLLAKAINEDTNKNDNLVYAQCMTALNTPTQSALTPVNPQEIYMYGGSSGLESSKDSYYYSLEETYKLLEGEPVDIIVPTEAFIDDIEPNKAVYGSEGYGGFHYHKDRDYLTIAEDGRKASYYEQLLLYCIKQLRFGFVTHGILGFNNTPDRDLYGHTDSYLTEVIKASMWKNRSFQELEPWYHLVSVVAGDLQTDYGSSLGNGYTVYAGLASSTRVDTNTTNKPFRSSVTLYNEFQEKDITELSDMGVLTFRASPLYNRVVVANGITSASPDNQLRYFCNTRMIQLTVCFVKELMETFIGEDLTSLMDNGIIEEELHSLMEFLKDNRILKDYNIQLLTNDEEGTMTVLLDLQTIYMVEYIKASGEISYEA